MNILFGLPEWDNWKEPILKLPHKVYLMDFKEISALIKFINENKIDAIIPCKYDQMFFIIDNINRLDKLVKYIICPKDKQIINLLDTKNEFYKYMTKLGFAEYIPKIFITHNGTTKTNHCKITYPCIFKLNKSASAIGSFIIQNNKDLIKANTKKNYVIQEYIASPNEYSGHFFVLNGQIKYFVFYMLENKETHYIQQGKMLSYIKNTDGICLDIFSEIFNKLNYTGFACIDFRLNSNNTPKIFEINPRLGGTIVNNADDFIDVITKSLKM